MKLKLKRDDILSRVDHTLLNPCSTWDEIRQICEDGITYGTASVCIPPSFVSAASSFSSGETKICTVIGFPNGYSETAVKIFEAEQAVFSGADELDMVINLGALKEGCLSDVLSEIRKIKKTAGERILKVIVETCLLTEAEKIAVCEIVSESGADYIKTSTGFSAGGATFDDVKLFKKHVAPHVKIKAAGGIAAIEDAEHFISIGADRLGTSRIIKLLKNQNTTGY